MSKFLTEARKFLVAATGVIGEALTLGLLHGTAQHEATVVVGVISAILVYLVPNGTAPAAPNPIDPSVKP